MRLHNCAALAAALALAACAGTSGNTNTNSWPDPQTLQSGLTLAEAGWAAFCGIEKSPAACRANQKKVTAAETAANDALAAYAQACASGNVTQAVLDNAQKLVADVASIVADTKSRS